MTESTYRCAACNGPVALVDGRVERACDCGEAPVVANMAAVTRGTGGLKVG